MNRTEIKINPQPKFEISPWLFMQFMEPLGTTDSSVEAGWDFERDCWREDLIETTKELAPGMIRWGGCLTSYYRWKEAVGTREKRVPMLNLCWGGIETNQVGTHEFIDFCCACGAEPLIGINFEADGRQKWGNHPKAGFRSAGPEEAAEWIDYCNNPDNRERKANGAEKPFNVRMWQIGNETSYDPQGFDCETSAERTVAFAKAMRKADPDIKLLGWGDSGWARRLLEVAGEYIDYVAFHHHWESGLPDSPLNTHDYRKDPSLTWEHLMNAHKSMQKRIDELRSEVAMYKLPLAMTEGHFVLKGRNRCEVLSTWAAGVANARVFHVQERNGDILKVATMADFFGNRWLVNAIMLPTPRTRAKAFMMPVARVMALYRKYTGTHAVAITKTSSDLDLTASRSGEKVFIHAVNTNMSRSVSARIGIDGRKIISAKVHVIADEPMNEIDETVPDRFSPVTEVFQPGDSFTFPPASVSAIELETMEAGE